MTTTDPERADFTLERKLWGQYSPVEGIALEWDLPLSDLLETTAHEVAHAKGLGEDEAHRFGKAFAERHASEFLGGSPLGGATLLAKAAFFSELGRLRGWSEWELTGVLNQL